ncbi:MAG: oligosaccharide flippase family protein [Pseudomonadota bacterium]
MATLRAAAIINGSSQYLIYALSFVRVAVISRLLVPSDIGAFAVAVALMMVLRVFRVFGTWEYIIATKDITTERLRTCFTVMSTMATTTFILTVLFAPQIATFFKADVLAQLIPLMSLSFLVLPFGFIAQAMMHRQMRMLEIAIIKLLGALTEITVAISLALLDVGVMALAWGFFAGNVVATVSVLCFERSYIAFRPGVPHFREVVKFGAASASATFLQQVGDIGAPLILGRGTDATTVGFFSRGQTLINFFRQGVEQAMAPVTTPWFAQKSRSDPSMLADGYMKITSLVSAVTWPFYAFVFVHAVSIVPILLGPGWDASVPVSQALAAGGLVSPFALYGTSMMAGQGRVNRRLLFTGVVQVVRLTLMVAAIPYGLTAFAWALAASHAFAFALIGFFLRTTVGLSLRKLAMSLLGPAAIGLATLVANYSLLFAFGPRLSSVCMGALATLALWWGWLMLSKHPLRFEILTLFSRISGRLKQRARR